MSASAQARTLGLIAGAGEYPRLVIEGAKKAGVRIVCAGMRGAVDPSLAVLCDAYRSFRVGAVEAPLAYFLSEGVTEAMLTGQIKPACIYTMWPDATARRLLAQLERRNAHTIFGAVCQFAAAHGITILPATTYMEAFMPGEGLLAGPAPTEAQMEEARTGMALAREIARLDIGQSLIIHGDQVLCIEGFKGTNECLREGGGRPYPVTLCKVTKPGHDMRFDVPCIGMGTIRNCLRANVRHIVLEANKTIIFQQEAVQASCQKHGITLQALSCPPQGEERFLPPTHDDASHAGALARELEALGMGHAAIVCDGVVIAVEDPEGGLKCIRRAGAYMKRIRFARLVNWLFRILLGRKSAPPSPMVMVSTQAFSPQEQALAQQAGIRLKTLS